MVAFMDPRLANGVATRITEKFSERARTGCERVASTLYLFESCFEKTYRNCDRSTRRTVQTPRLNGSVSCCGDVVQLVRTLPRRRLESRTVTARCSLIL